MPNYYELLHIPWTATDAEIAGAIDQQYDQWRALVTHHDDKVRDQANQAMRMLEQIRATLSDPAKRNDYDEAIGKGVTAGLADPTTVLEFPVWPMTPPTPDPTLGATGAAGIVNAWVCPKCGVANGIGTRFCKNCGTALGRECPNCGKTIEAAAKFCPDCGVDVAKATIAKQIAEQEKRRAEEERRHFLEELDVNWHYRTRQIAEQEPASYSQVWLVQIESSFGETVDALIKALNSDLAGYRFRTAYEPNLQGVIRTYDKSGANSSDPLQLQVYVEPKEGQRRRVLVRLFSNKFFGDKTKNRFEEALLANLRDAIAIVDVTRM